MARMAFEAGVQHGVDGVVALEQFDDGSRVLTVPIHSEGKGLRSTKGEIRIPRSTDRADRVGDVAEVGLDVGRVGGHEAADDVGVSADVLRGRVDHDVGPEPERGLQIGAGEGVVDHQQRIVTMGDLGDRGDVDDGQQRVGRRLDPDHGRVGRPVVFERRQVGEVVGRPADTGLGEHGRDQAEGAAVCVIAHEHVLAGAQHAQDGVFGCEPRGERHAGLRLFERGQGTLERGSGGVAGAGVLVALVFADALLGEGRGLEDRHGDRAGDRLGLLADMDGPGGEAPAVCCVVGGFGRHRTAPWLAASDRNESTSVRATTVHGRPPSRTSNAGA